MTSSGTRASREASPEPTGPGLRLALAQLPARMRPVVRQFRELTGFSAVTSLRAAVGGPGGAHEIAPAVHPRCACQLRRLKRDAPCQEQWRWHLKTGARTRSAQSHVCPLGLRCACVPIFYGETLVGTAKVVAGPDAPKRRFELAAQTLDLVVSRVCQDYDVAALTEELEGLREQLTVLQIVRESASESDPSVPAQASGSPMDQTLVYLGAHYLDPGLSLTEVSRALGVNGKYLTRSFTRVLGQHMHTYIIDLRVHHACRLLLSTDRAIKAIAVESGFRRPERFRRVFREQVGVPPAIYRRTFRGA